MVLTEGRWIGSADEAAFGWLSTATGAVTSSGVLILPPVGYAWWSSYYTFRVLAERLAAIGHTVLRLQYYGSANAVGSQSDANRMLAWKRSVDQAAEELRSMGCRQLALVGANLGGSLGLQMASALGAPTIAAWAPVINGRREARALRVRSLAVPRDALATGSIAVAGTIFGSELLTDIAAIDLLALTEGPERALIIDDAGADPLVKRLEELGVAVHRDDLDAEQALTGPAEDAIAAEEVIDSIVNWIGPGSHDPVDGAVKPRSTIRFAWQHVQIEESLVRIGPEQLVGVVSCPSSGRRVPGTVVLLSSGSEPHAGAGRVWVELARDLAATGFRVLRVDFRGWGESPDQGYAPGRPYDAHCVADTIDIVTALRHELQGPVTLVGLCAGAWIALKATLTEPADAVVALNPQLYWQPGDPVEALLAATRERRTLERLDEENGRRSGRWDALDRSGERNPAGAWLDQLARSPTRVCFLFAEGDDGLEYLNNRLARRLADVTANDGIRVRTIQGIDHAMHRTWLRPQMFAAIRAAISAETDVFAEAIEQIDRPPTRIMRERPPVGEGRRRSLRESVSSAPADAASASRQSG